MVDKRDGNFPGPGVHKKLLTIDISHTTDVIPRSTVAGADYDAQADGITPVAKSLRLDGGLPPSTAGDNS